MKKKVLHLVIILITIISFDSVYSQSNLQRYAQMEKIEDETVFEDAKLTAYDAIIKETEQFEDTRKVIDILCEQKNSAELIYMKGLSYYKESFKKKHVKNALKELKKGKKLLKSKKIDAYDPNSRISPLFGDCSIVSLYREEAKEYINCFEYDLAIPILEWLSECDSTPYSHYLLANCYYDKDVLRKAEKHYTLAKEMSDKSFEYFLLSNEINRLLEQVKNLREIRRQQNAQTFAQVASVLLVAGATAAQTYSQSQATSSNNNYNTTSNTNVNNKNKSSYSSNQGISTSKSDGGTWRIDFYKRYENEIKDHLKRIERVRNNDGLTSNTKTSSIRSDIDNARQKQEEMRKLRLDAKAQGIEIKQSKYETITIE